MHLCDWRDNTPCSSFEVAVLNFVINDSALQYQFIGRNNEKNSYSPQGLVL